MIFDVRKKTFVAKPLYFTEEDILENNLNEKYHIDNDLIGTPEYISPEALLYRDSSPSVDLWALGCIIYLFFHGVTPFKDKNQNLIFENIKKNEYKLNENLNDSTKDIINKLLVLDPTKRLGGGTKENRLDIASLKKHKFFENFDFENLHKLHPPIDMKKVVYAKIKYTNSTDNILKNQIQRKSLLNRVNNQNDLNNKNGESKYFNGINSQKSDNNLNSNLTKIENMKKEIEILYGRNTEGDYEFNKNHYDERGNFGKIPFEVIDINQEIESICLQMDYKSNKEKAYKEDQILLEGKYNYYYLFHFSNFILNS